MTEHPNLSAALVAALAELTVVEKGRTANAGSYKYDYADLGDIVKKTRPALAEHGVVALTPVVDNGNDLQVTVVLLHTSGEKLEFGPFSFPHGKDAQATGSMVTYHRRYALVSALGMAAGDDDDGAAAQPRQQAKAEPTPEHVRRLVGAMNSIEDEAKRVAVKKAFLDEWGKPQDVARADADAAEQFITDTVTKLDKVEASTEPSGSQGGEGASNPPEDPPAPPVASAEESTPRPSAEAAAVTKPAANKPSAAARAALAGEKPALGAVKRNEDAKPTTELLQDAFGEHIEEAS